MEILSWCGYIYMLNIFASNKELNQPWEDQFLLKKNIGNQFDSFNQLMGVVNLGLVTLISNDDIVESLLALEFFSAILETKKTSLFWFWEKICRF